MGCDMKETVEWEFYLRVRGVKIWAVSGWRAWKGSGNNIEWIEEFDSSGVIGSCEVERVCVSGGGRWIDNVDHVRQ